MIATGVIKESKLPQCGHNMDKPYRNKGVVKINISFYHLKNYLAEGLCVTLFNSSHDNNQKEQYA